MNSSEYIPDCTNQCTSAQHGEIITAAISKRSISDADLCSFLNFVCSRCESVVDSAGRTALHVAASCGRLELVKWLVHSRHADINLKDQESGYTALHRSVFYGKLNVAVELIKLGASTSDLDADYLTAIEHSMKDGLSPISGSNGGELYSWGSNNNNLLGPQPSRQLPELLDIFHKEFPKESVKQMCIGQFHSVIVTESGKALSCGHGQGGRLGLGDEKAVVFPHVLNFANNQKGEVISCLQASISRDHSIFLCSDGNVYTCGLNTYHVLGQIPPPEIVLIPKPIKHFSKEILGVCAGQFHSVVWGPDALYTWGLNAGQLGHKVNDKKKEQFVITPKSVNIVNDINITCVAASNGATAVCTKKGDVYLLHEYLCRKIASRLLNAVQISILGGKLESPLLDRELSKELHKELKVVILTNTGNLLLWQESDQQLCRCIYSINRAIIVKQVSMNLNELLLVSDCGEAFKGIIKPRKKTVTNSSEKNIKNNLFHKFLDKEECVSITLQKISRIHRAVSIQSDLKGKDYCVVQALPYKTFTFPQIAESEMKHHFEILLRDSDQTDNIHDVVFKAGNKLFPAHKYIVTKKSGYLEKIMEDKNMIIDLGSVNPYIFEQFLEFVYTGECELSTCGEVKNKGLRQLCLVKKQPKKTEEIIDTENIPDDMSAYKYYSKEGDKEDNKQIAKKYRNPVRLLQELAKKFECTVLHKNLSHLDMDNYTVRHKNEILTASVGPPKFNRLDLPNLHDVTVKCKDGRELKAHKCILSARMEYFNNLFSVRWGGGRITEVNLPYAKTTVEALLEFLYTDSLSNLKDIEYDNLFKVLVLADQLFVLRLKDQCEMLLSDTLTLKSVVQTLSFAHLYNAEKLKYCCMKFIISNITPLLENRTLDDLDVELLKELSEFYFNEKDNVWCRVITPYSIAVQDEIILSVGTTYPVDLTSIVEKVPVKSSQKKRTRVHKTSERHVSISVENDASLDELQFPDEPISVPELKQLPNRLKSVILASSRIKSEIVEPQYTKLVSERNIMDISTSLDESFEFPELSSPPHHHLHGISPKSPPQRVLQKPKMVKLSQKQRKKLSSETASDTESQSPPVLIPPKNPWKQISSMLSPSSRMELKHNIDDIISDEKKQKENLVKLKSKLLVCTQIEDKAIDDLHRFYNTENVLDEVIIIERVNSGAIASPVWVPRAKQIC